jgi:hypothetical protein
LSDAGAHHNEAFRVNAQKFIVPCPAITAQSACGMRFCSAFDGANISLPGRRAASTEPAVNGGTG